MADARFWNRMADRYARMPVRDPVSYAEKLRRTQALFSPDWRVLEVGCGTGSTALEHAPHVAEYRATDLSPRMIEIAREKAALAPVPGLTFEVAGIEEIAAPENGYDAILAMSVLHLVEDRQAVLARLASMLRPGGVLVSSTFCLKDEMRWFGLIAPVGHALGVLPRVRSLSAAELQAGMRAAGLEIRERWQPTPRSAQFIIAERTAAELREADAA